MAHQPAGLAPNFAQQPNSQAQFQPESSQQPYPQQQSADISGRQMYSTVSASAPDAVNAVVGANFCAPTPVSFFVKDKLLSCSGGDATVLDGSGKVAFSVDGKVKSIRSNRIFRDSSGNILCAMQGSLTSARKKWVICRGATVQDNAVVANVFRQMWSWHGGVEVKLPGSDEPAYTLRQQGVFSCKRREIDIMHRGSIIGQVKRVRSGQAIFLGKQSYQVTINPGYDHAFLLCVIIIMDHYFQEEANAYGLYGTYG